MSRSNFVSIELTKEDQKFSAAHFTIFNAKERERLHGHNFLVSVHMTFLRPQDGLSFDYGEVKDKIRKLCRSLNEYTLLPGKSKLLIIESQGKFYHVKFNKEEMFFLKKDTLVLPIVNTTVEEFSRYFLEQFLLDKKFFQKLNFQSLKVKVASGPGQWGESLWEKK